MCFQLPRTLQLQQNLFSKTGRHLKEGLGMVDWKNIGVPIIVALIAGGVALIAALINGIIAAVFTPNISITRASTSNTHTTIFDITNSGSASAKDLKLTILYLAQRDTLKTKPKIQQANAFHNTFV
jgi:hypothetical protein